MRIAAATLALATAFSLPALAADVFPSDRVTGNWLRNAAVVPHPLRGDADAVPQLRELSNQGFKEFAGALTADQRLAEDRLAYVGVTRARRRLYGTSHAWDAHLVRPRRDSEYLAVLTAHADLAQSSEISESNPLALTEAATRWPVVDDGPHWQRRREAAALVEQFIGGPPPAITDLDTQREADDWRRWSEALLAQGTQAFVDLCAREMEANPEACEASVEQSLAMVTSLNPYIGYEKAAALAKEAFKTGKTIRELCREQNILPDDELAKALDPWSMTEPQA